MNQAVKKRAQQIMATMPDEFPPAYAEFMAQREEQVARLLAAHRPVIYPSKSGIRCVHPGCDGVVMQSGMDVYRHQAAILETA